MSEERITLRDDLDGLDDDDTIVEDREIWRVKLVVFVLVAAFFTLVTVILVVFFQPEGQAFVEYWPNGYRKTRTTYVSSSNAERRIQQGPHAAWHENGARAERGRYELGARSGEWRFWDAEGVLDEMRSGWYESDRRVRGLQ